MNPLPQTIDWVTQITGEPGPSVCSRVGHHTYERQGEPQMVHGRYAANLRCVVCGRRAFHWLADGAGGRGAC